MLELIRERAQGMLVWTIVGLIIITFALFGLSSYLGGGGDGGNVAEVNGTEISENQLLRAQRDYLQRLQQIQGEQFDPDLFDSERVKREVLQGLVRRELIQQHVNELGYQPSAGQVLEAIHSFQVFQEDGKFSSERYKTILRQQGLVPEQFERDVASDLAVEQFRNGIAGSAFVTDAELQRYIQLKYQQRDIGYLVVTLDRFLEQARPDEAAIKQFYETNRQRFMTPEKVSINYIELDLERLSRQYEVSQQEVEQYYTEHRDNYTEGEERRHVRHILVAVNEQRSQEEALTQAQQVTRQLEQGADFAALAKQHSDDPGSAAQGGDLGTIQRGAFDPDFEQAAFALAEGEISEPVKTRFGYHVIRVEEIQAAEVKPLAEVEDSIRQELRMRQAEQEFYEKVDALSRYSYEMPDSLQGVAEQVGLTVQQSPLFSRQGGEGFLANPKVAQAAFSDEVLQQRRNSEVLELDDTHFLVLRVNEHQPAQAKPLEEVRAQIERQLKRQQAQQLALEAARSIQDELKESAAPAEVAARHGYDWQAAGLIDRRPREGERLDGMIRQSAFSMPSPQPGQNSHTLSPMQNGNVAVIRLQAVQPGQLPEGGELRRERQQLSAVFGRSEYEALLESLRSEADIRISEKLGGEAE